MKYIKTKDGKIWSFSKPYGNFVYEVGNEKNAKWWFEIGEVVKQADKIEDLCDAVVRIKNNRLPLCFNLPINATSKWIDDYLKIMMKDKNIIEIYGAIWTDKGLVYVAKMNDKGEFELL